jgi:predicted ATPase/DNA-binding SARP family transcriptional activator
MTSLQVALLGTYDVYAGDAPITEFHSNKVRALLAYLAMEADRPHERALLAAMLWADAYGDQALGLLRQALHRLSQALEPFVGGTPVLMSTRQSIRLHPQAPIRLDAHRFRTLIDEVQQHPHRRVAACRPCVQRLAEAAELYRGPFMSGFGGVEGLPFEEWLLTWRERLSHQLVWALAQLAAHYQERESYPQAIAVLRRWLEQEPWREEAHRSLMRALALDGQRSAALVQFERCRSALIAELGTTPSPETLTLLRQIRDGGLVSAPQRPVPRGRGAVPALTTPLVGRDALLTQVAEQLANPECRMLTLVGPGGSGKTRLAQAAAASEAVTFCDGAAFISLALTSATSRLAAEIVEQLGLSEGVSGGAEQQLYAYLGQRELLLVLDGCEHLEGAGALLARLLQAAPQLTILATSREPLHLEAEWILRVEGLAFPPPDAADPLETYPAAQLFMATARRTAPEFQPDPEQEQAIAGICRLVAGLPLAINLAASLVRHVAPAAILEALHADLDILTTSMTDTAERQRSMRAVLEASWQRLDAAERETLLGCAVFQGEFDATAATAVLAQEQRAAARNIAALVDKSLVVRTPSGRFLLHELVRAFASRRPEQSDAPHASSREALANRHSAYYLALVAGQAEQLIGPEVSATAELLSANLDNIRLAWRRAVERGDLGGLTACASGMQDYWTLRGMYVEGAAALGHALELPGAGEAAAPDERANRCRLLVGLSAMLYACGKYPEMIAAAREASELATRLRLPLLETAAQVELGKALWRRGDPSARAHLERAVQLSRGIPEAEDERSRSRVACDALYYLGLVAWSQGAFAEARGHYVAALETARAIAYRYGEADALNNLALVALFEGAYAEAETHCSSALRIYRSIGTLSGEGLGLITVGLVEMYHGDPAAGLAALNQSLQIHRQTGDHQNASITLVLIGMLLTRVGDYAAARAPLDEGIELCRTIDHHWAMSIGLGYYGLLEHLLGNQEAAIAHCRAALAFAEHARDPVVSAYALTHLGHALAASGDQAEAGVAYRHAVELRAVLGQRHLLHDPLAGLARLALADGDIAHARAYIEETLHVGAESMLDGSEEPVRLLVTCHRVLAAAGDERAPRLLAEARRQLGSRAARIGDERMRRLFVSRHALYPELEIDGETITPAQEQ